LLDSLLQEFADNGATTLIHRAKYPE